MNKNARYYGLRLVSLIYKLLAILTVLIIVGGTGYISLAAANSPLSDNFDFTWWLPRVLSMLIGGGMLAFTFFVIAQVIDLQLSTNERVIEIAKQSQDMVKAIEAAASLMKTHNEQITQLLDQQARLVRLQGQQPTPPPAKAQTKTIGNN